MSNTSRLFVHLEIKSNGAQNTLEAIKSLLEDQGQLQEAGIDKVFDIVIEGSSIEFYTTQREGYADEHAEDIAKLLGTKFPYKITSFSADEIIIESAFFAVIKKSLMTG